MDEEIKRIMALSGRAVAGGAFEDAVNTMQNYHIPTLEERLEFSSANQTLTDVAERIDSLKQDAPEGKELVVIMRTADGRLMDVNSVRAEGFNAFRASGNVEGMPCEIIAHISTLSFFCSYEVKSKGRGQGFGFTSVLPKRQPITEPPLTPEHASGDTD